jgi:hypothetical protein
MIQMKWIKDTTGRFSHRPHYLPDELDLECERIVASFLQNRYGRVEFPISTSDLTILVENETADLDMYADLSEETGEVEGVTEFVPGQKPRVKISRVLSQAYNMENRLRTTLTHEYGHVRFHGFMYAIQSSTQSLFPVNEVVSNKCKRENIVGARRSDWMEWQAAYASGAFLMPITQLRQAVKAFRAENAASSGLITTDSPQGLRLTAKIATEFRVSRDAARVRLLQREFLVPEGVKVSGVLFKN